MTRPTTTGEAPRVYTAENLTDAEIRELGDDARATLDAVKLALLPRDRITDRRVGRARVAEILNARAKAVQP